MKHTQLIINAFFFIALVFFSSCGDKIKETFYLTDEAKRYQIDTTITSFNMVDNYGITEEFYVDESIWYTTHHYFSNYGNGITDETFGIAYFSSLNDYSFMFVLRADIEDTDLEVEWNQKDRLVYNFGTQEVESEIMGEVSFYDTLTVKGVKYENIIEIDYSKVKNKIDTDTPVKTYISGDKGLIKFIRKDNITMERVQ
uniref:hypothetical protein n=1 Tax=uncultured Draconibacterium sp. TaxID=1573823 RepID=UPI0032169DAA